jgi:hypothetical protein
MISLRPQLKQRGKDQIANVAQRNGVYQTIEAILRAGLIAVRETSREKRRPERTAYEATDRGLVPRFFLLEQEYMAAATRAEIRWLRGIISEKAG